MPALIVPHVLLVPAELSFRVGMRGDWKDHTCRLVYADWLDDRERYQSAARLRWSVAVRHKAQENVAWEGDADWDSVCKAINGIKLEWVRRLYGIEAGRIMRDKYPNAPEWSAITTIADDTLHVAELYALLLATEEELDAVRNAARNTAKNAAKNTVYYAAEKAARNAARNAAKVFATFQPFSEST
jgi:uncharacterized protein (TIGR02996 family)